MFVGGLERSAQSRSVFCYFNGGHIHSIKLNEIRLAEDINHAVELYPLVKNLIKLEIANALTANQIYLFKQKI